MKLRAAVTGLALLAACGWCAEPRLPDCVSLDGQPAAPNPVDKDRHVVNVREPVVRLMRTQEAAPKGTVLIFPSGGYHVLSIISDGVDKARFFNEQGFDAAILEYHIRAAGGERHDATRDLALKDALAAVTLVREQGRALGLHGGRFVLAGASAGGHLAARAVAALPAADRPDDLVLFYPAYLEETPPGEKIPGMRVPAGTLPRLIGLIAANDTPGWIGGLRSYVEAWRKAGGDAALEVYDDGHHGFRAGSRAAAAWPGRLTEFLRRESAPAHDRP